MSDEATPSRAMSAASALERHIREVGLDEGRRNRLGRWWQSSRDERAPEVGDVARLADVAFDIPVEDVQLAVPPLSPQGAPDGQVERDLEQMIQEREVRFVEALQRRSGEAEAASAFEACERLRDMSPDEIARLAEEGAAEARASIEATAEVWMHERMSARSKSGG